MILGLDKRPSNGMQEAILHFLEFYDYELNGRGYLHIIIIMILSVDETRGNNQTETTTQVVNSENILNYDLNRIEYQLVQPP